MGMPDEFSVHCDHCAQFNLVDVWCGDCVERNTEVLKAENARLRTELEQARAENERLRNGLRYLSVHLGVSSNLEIAKLSDLAWAMAEEGKEAPAKITGGKQE